MGSNQNLPIGAATGTHALRRQRRIPVLRPAVRRGHWLLALIGLLGAGIGLASVLTEPQVQVRSGPGSYRVGGVELRALGDGSYEGGGAAMVVSERGGEVRAAASTYLDGRHMVGSCVYRRGADQESCLFSLGDERFTATDRRSGGGWKRTYSDGGTVDLRLDGGPVPVPFAVGRRAWPWAWSAWSRR
jgi:hypothetical protein